MLDPADRLLGDFGGADHGRFTDPAPRVSCPIGNRQTSFGRTEADEAVSLINDPWFDTNFGLGMWTIEWVYWQE
jgi:hypothetical protein